VGLVNPVLNVMKTFFFHNLRMFIIRWSVCSWQAPMFADKAKDYPTETPFRCSTLGQSPVVNVIN
jgi:hypothetical protein